MTNPFLQSRAGVFAVTTSPTTPTQAESICAAVIRRIAAPPQNMSALSQDWWTQVVNNMPLVSVVSQSQRSIEAFDAQIWAALMLGDDIMAAVPGGRAIVSGWLAGPYSPYTSLNSFVIVDRPDKRIAARLAFFDTEGRTFRHSDMVIDAVSARNLATLQAVFGSAPLANVPYLCRL
ncbi:hypothetical protein [Methylobacterium sp. SyP6R]|uniref:hypothetical protein n=1 Tax=Methylobacterium sp. SyP6R TaxID=2718876 RepID=UPI001F19063F|nr:hypothetical protein [Methylobacterium sp. SyP6R]MCF4123824.1 hypothetical protein [Methylobacterium sp. SyP6R]